jgi:hypothetical protein
VEYGLHVLGFVQTPDKRNRQFITQDLGDFAMRWRDIRFEKPTAGHGDEDALILQLLTDGSIGKWRWDSLARITAWMPLSELPAFNPIPDPPEGWRFVDSSDVDRRDVQWWDLGAKAWKDCGAWSAGFPFDKDRAYIVPIKPPEPEYRPFANAAEFEPYRDKWWRCKNTSFKNPPLGYSDTHWGATPFSLAFDEYEFEDGTPLGVRVDQ